MTRTTRDVVTDLWPLYTAGEASADTRALVEAFLEQDPELARRLRKEQPDELLRPVALAMPPDHERETLLRTQRRRALQSMVVNALALLGSLAMTAVCLWRVIPRLVPIFVELGVALPAATRLTIVASNWAVRLALPFVVVLALLYLFRRRLKVPEPVRSGTALAVVTGAVLLLTQLAWLALLIESSTALEQLHRAGRSSVPHEQPRNPRDGIR